MVRCNAKCSRDRGEGMAELVKPDICVIGAGFTGLGVRVIEGAARFKDASTVVVGDAIEIKARRFVVATGSSPALPPIPGLAATPHLTNATVFDLTECPEHLIVIGAGPIGLEL